MALDCSASVATAQVTCSPAQPGGGALRDVIYGGQNVYVTMRSTNRVIADTFAMETTVQNLLPQPIGTTDGVTAHPDGVKVFFVLQPVATGGSGQIRIQNPDGYGMFTEAGQPFYRYTGVLATNAVSPARTWKFVLDPGVTTFRFQVNVAAPVPYPDGWVEVTPASVIMDFNESITVKAVVRTALGERAPVQSIQWSTSWPHGVFLAPQAGDTITRVWRAGLGSAIIKATSGARTGSMKVTARMMLGAVSRGAFGMDPSDSYVKLLMDGRPYFERSGREVWDGREMVPAGNGFTVALVSPADGTTWEERTFNTGGPDHDGAAMNALISYLEELWYGHVVMIAVADDAGLNVEGSCTLRSEPWVERGLKALEALGARQIRDYCFRDSWAMIALVGEGRARAEALARGAEAAVQSPFFHDVLSVP
ncbi:MAG TPA: interleukin-like EMT inducer domain-containing protein [Longimicrobium sp.]